MDEKKNYKKSLGLFELVSLGVGGTIGSGIFVVPGISAGIAGPSSLFAWLIVAISAFTVMFSLAWASSKYPSTGAFWPIFSKVFGDRISTFLILLYLVSSVFGIATIAAGIGQYISFFGIGGILFIELLIIVFFCLLNIRGIYLSSATENILTTIKTVPLIILAILLLPYIQKANFSPFYPAAPMDFLKALIIVYWPFTGFEICAIPAEETKNPKIIFKSLIIVMAIVTLVYMLLNISLIGSMGSKVLASSPAPIATASGLLLKDSEKIIAIIGIIAMLSALNAYLVGTSRVMQNISCRFKVPLLKELGIKGTPVAAIILSAFFSGALLFFSNSFNQLADISVITTLLPYIFICLSTYKLFTARNIRLVASIGTLTTLAILVIYFII